MIYVIPHMKDSGRRAVFGLLINDFGSRSGPGCPNMDLSSAALHSAMRQELIFRCPTDLVEPPRVIQKETRYYTADSLKKLYESVQGHWLEPVVHLAFFDTRKLWFRPDLG